MKKFLLVGLLFVGGCAKTLPPINEQAVINYNNTTYKPRKVAEVEGRDLYMVPVRPWGEEYKSGTHFVYFFKDGEVKSVNFQTTSQSGKHKQTHDHTITIDGSPYKRQDVPNE